MTKNKIPLCLVLTSLPGHKSLQSFPASLVPFHQRTHICLRVPEAYLTQAHASAQASGHLPLLASVGGCLPWHPHSFSVTQTLMSSQALAEKRSGALLALHYVQPRGIPQQGCLGPRVSRGSIRQPSISYSLSFLSLSHGASEMGGFKHRTPV